MASSEAVGDVIKAASLPRWMTKSLGLAGVVMAGTETAKVVGSAGADAVANGEHVWNYATLLTDGLGAANEVLDNKSGGVEKLEKVGIRFAATTLVENIFGKNMFTGAMLLFMDKIIKVAYKLLGLKEDDDDKPMGAEGNGIAHASWDAMKAKEAPVKESLRKFLQYNGALDPNAKDEDMIKQAQALLRVKVTGQIDSETVGALVAAGKENKAIVAVVGKSQFAELEKLTSASTQIGEAPAHVSPAAGSEASDLRTTVVPTVAVTALAPAVKVNKSAIIAGLKIYLGVAGGDTRDQNGAPLSDEQIVANAQRIAGVKATNANLDDPKTAADLLTALKKTGDIMYLDKDGSTALASLAAPAMGAQVVSPEPKQSAPAPKSDFLSWLGSQFSMAAKADELPPEVLARQMRDCSKAVKESILVRPSPSPSSISPLTEMIGQKP